MGLIISHFCPPQKQLTSPVVELGIETEPETAFSLAPGLDSSLEPDLVLDPTNEAEPTFEPDLALDPETEPESDMALELTPETNDSWPATGLDKIIANQAPTGFTLPEDATLRRHTLSHIHALVESGLPPRPTDSVLRRHHEHLVEVEILKHLGGKPQ